MLHSYLQLQLRNTLHSFAWRTEDKMPKSYFVVRATIHDPSKREAFDSWYKNVHLPDALRLFGVKRA